MQRELEEKYYHACILGIMYRYLLVPAHAVLHRESGISIFEILTLGVMRACPAYQCIKECLGGRLS
jgi:hypothetical protein